MALPQTGGQMTTDPDSGSTRPESSGSVARVSLDLVDGAVLVARRRPSLARRPHRRPSGCPRTGVVLRRLARLALGEMAAGRAVHRSRNLGGTDRSAACPTGGNADRRHRAGPLL